MPTITVQNNIDFYYTDSGPVANTAYTTLIFIHGHTFNNGVFQRLSSIAKSHSLRIICVHRRGYHGSTPYTPEEANVITDGSDVERVEFFQQQGMLLGLFIDGLILELSLPNEGVAVIGWSLGATFSLALLSSINRIPKPARRRLKAYLKCFILWDAPSHALGIPSPPGSYVPFWDEDIPLEDRGAAFGKWCSSYFRHGNIASRDLAELAIRYPDSSRRATIELMSEEELHSVLEFGQGPKYDTFFIEPSFSHPLSTLINKALFDSGTREAWGGVKVWHLYGSANAWNIIYAVWVLEELARLSELRFKVMQGANHFVMWEHPEHVLKTLVQCIKD